MLICDMPRFLSRGPVQIVHICERCAMMIFTQITHFTAKFFSGGKNKVLYLLHTPFFYVGIHSKIQANFIGQDIKKNTVRNYRTDIGNKNWTSKRGVQRWQYAAADQTSGQYCRWGSIEGICGGGSSKSTVFGECEVGSDGGSIRPIGLLN